MKLKVHELDAPAPFPDEAPEPIPLEEVDLPPRPSSRQITAAPVERVSDTTVGPYASVGRLRMSYRAGGVALGSAVVVAQNAILTAAHNLYIAVRGGYMRSVFFSPGFYTPEGGSGVSPFGTWQATRIIVPSEWIESWERRLGFDFGICILDSEGGKDSRPVGDVVSPLPVDAGYPWGENQPCEMVGYPGNYFDASTMVSEEGLDPIDEITIDGTVSVEGLIGKGASGGPWLFRTWAHPNTDYVVGVTSQHMNIPNDPDRVGSSKFTEGTKDFINRAIGNG